MAIEMLSNSNNNINPLPKVNNVNASIELQPIVSNVVTKKPSGLKRLWKGFFAEDIKTVKADVVKQVIEPSIKTGIANAITTAVYMWLFGKNGYSTGPGGLFRPLMSGNSNLINYASGIYRLQNGPTLSNGSVPGSKISVDNSSVGTYRSTDVYDPEYIRYPSWQDAENVYTGLCKQIVNYKVATVRQLYNLSNVSNPEVILGNWGWFDLPWHRVIPVGDGTWILKLPQPQFLNNK